METFDKAFLDSTGSFLVGQLEKLDPTINEPLYDTTYSRDVTLRGDVSLADESASFTQSSFAANQSGNGGYVTGSTTTVGEVGVDTKKVVQPMLQWSKKLGWNVFELERSMKLGQPIDVAKLKSLAADWQIVLDRAFYLGAQGNKGFLTRSDVSTADATTGQWDASDITADEMLTDIEDLLSRVYANTGFAACPTDLRVDPISFGKLANMKVSSAGNMSVLKYIAENCISAAVNSRPLNIQPVKWCSAGAGANAKAMAVAYTNAERFLRFPVVALQRQPVVFGDISQSVAYASSHGVVEAIYPETIGYMTNLSS
jgi:hypothetical protein